MNGVAVLWLRTSIELHLFLRRKSSLEQVHLITLVVLAYFLVESFLYSIGRGHSLSAILSLVFSLSFIEDGVTKSNKLISLQYPSSLYRHSYTQETHYF